MRREVVVVCRGANEPLKAGFVLGYSCKYCKKELQVSPGGLAQLKVGGVPLCNPCGFKYTDAAMVLGKLEGVALSPAALETLLDELGKK
jgi:hypothetical protein